MISESISQAREAWEMPHRADLFIFLSSVQLLAQVTRMGVPYPYTGDR